MPMKDTGLFVYAKVKGVTRKPATTKEGKPYTRTTIYVVFLNNPTADLDVVDKAWISAPEGAVLPEMNVDAFYTFPVTVAGGEDRRVFFNLRTNQPIQPDTEA